MGSPCGPCREGIAIARWYGREAWRVYEGQASEAELERWELLEMTEAHGGVISLSDMSRRRRKWNDSQVAEMALRKLARESYGEVYTDEETGGRPALRFRLWTDGPGPGVTLN